MKIGDLQSLNEGAIGGHSDFYCILSESHDVRRDQSYKQGETERVVALLTTTPQVGSHALQTA